MTNEEFLQRYDSGEPDFTEDEIEKMAYEEFGNWIRTAEGRRHRWYREVITIFEVNGRFFAVSWNRGLTELQEDDFDDAEAYEVEKKAKVIIEWVRKE